MRRLSLILIITGVLVLLYPLLDRAYTCYWQQKIFSKWGAGHLQENMNTEKDIGAELDETEVNFEENENEANFSSESETILRNTLGILEIEKINLKLPILRGTSKAILRVGAGLLDGTAGIGELGNTVLTAHRSHTYGRFLIALTKWSPGTV